MSGHGPIRKVRYLDGSRVVDENSKVVAGDSDVSACTPYCGGRLGTRILAATGVAI